MEAQPGPGTRGIALSLRVRWLGVGGAAGTQTKTLFLLTRWSLAIVTMRLHNPSLAKALALFTGLGILNARHSIQPGKQFL